MSVGDLFTKEMWGDVAKDIGGVAGRWWDENKDDLVDLAEDEAKEIFDSLRNGDTLGAKLEIASRMTRPEFKAYRDGTTAQLQGIALRRARLLGALEDLGTRAAKIIGAAAVGAIGL